MFRTRERNSNAFILGLKQNIFPTYTYRYIYICCYRVVSDKCIYGTQHSICDFSTLCLRRSQKNTKNFTNNTYAPHRVYMYNSLIKRYLTEDFPRTQNISTKIRLSAWKLGLTESTTNNPKWFMEQRCVSRYILASLIINNVMYMLCCAPILPSNFHFIALITKPLYCCLHLVWKL